MESSTPVSTWTANMRLRFETLADYRRRVLDGLPLGPGVLINHAEPDSLITETIKRTQKKQFEASR